ncbi:hypothetical protein EXIGLDRAFT_766865 [Exidia glandulosa HHB12029]|uniref:Uncharacterized protein n=1 Tax=Exidia glandulosa HHB12029 TaxID=1314781 RepID=A0A165JDV4_EXIGL|nr:hypothetical protein EXIGLDRAFT_766865 [Exidia glandulosa HHB12029]
MMMDSISGGPWGKMGLQASLAPMPAKKIPPDPPVPNGRATRKRVLQTGEALASADDLPSTRRKKSNSEAGALEDQPPLPQPPKAPAKGRGKKAEDDKIAHAEHQPPKPQPLKARTKGPTSEAQEDEPLPVPPPQEQQPQEDSEADSTSSKGSYGSNPRSRAKKNRQKERRRSLVVDEDGDECWEDVDEVADEAKRRAAKETTLNSKNGASKKPKGASSKGPTKTRGGKKSSDTRQPAPEKSDTEPEPEPDDNAANESDDSRADDDLDEGVHVGPFSFTEEEEEAYEQDVDPDELEEEIEADKADARGTDPGQQQQRYKPGPPPAAAEAEFMEKTRQYRAYVNAWCRRYKKNPRVWFRRSGFHFGILRRPTMYNLFVKRFSLRDRKQPGEGKEEYHRRYVTAWYACTKNKPKEEIKALRDELNKWYDEYEKQCGHELEAAGENWKGMDHAIKGMTERAEYFETRYQVVIFGFVITTSPDVKSIMMNKVFAGSHRVRRGVNQKKLVVEKALGSLTLLFGADQVLNAGRGKFDVESVSSSLSQPAHQKRALMLPAMTAFQGLVKGVTLSHADWRGYGKILAGLGITLDKWPYFARTPDEVGDNKYGVNEFNVLYPVLCNTITKREGTDQIRIIKWNDTQLRYKDDDYPQYLEMVLFRDEKGNPIYDVADALGKNAYSRRPWVAEIQKRERRGGNKSQAFIEEEPEVAHDDHEVNEKHPSNAKHLSNTKHPSNAQQLSSVRSKPKHKARPKEQELRPANARTSSSNAKKRARNDGSDESDRDEGERAFFKSRKQKQIGGGDAYDHYNEPAMYDDYEEYEHNAYNAYESAGGRGAYRNTASALDTVEEDASDREPFDEWEEHEERHAHDKGPVDEFGYVQPPTRPRQSKPAYAGVREMDAPTDTVRHGFYIKLDANAKRGRDTTRAQPVAPASRRQSGAKASSHKRQRMERAQGPTPYHNMTYNDSDDDRALPRASTAPRQRAPTVPPPHAPTAPPRRRTENVPARPRAPSVAPSQHAHSRAPSVGPSYHGYADNGSGPSRAPSVAPPHRGHIENVPGSSRAPSMPSGGNYGNMHGFANMQPGAHIPLAPGFSGSGFGGGMTGNGMGGMHGLPNFTGGLGPFAGGQGGMGMGMAGGGGMPTYGAIVDNTPNMPDISDILPGGPMYTSGDNDWVNSLPQPPHHPPPSQSD